MKYSEEDLAGLVKVTDEKNFDKCEISFKPENLINGIVTGNSYITVFDFTKVKFSFFSPAVISILGYEPEYLLSQGINFFFSLIHPDDILRHKVIHQEMISSYYSSPVNERLKLRLTADYRIKRKDNRYIRLLDQHNCIKMDKKGRPLLDLIVSTDITRYKTDNRMIFTISKYNERKKEFTEIHHNYITELKNGILTKREIEVVDFVNLGMLNKEISEKMNLSIDTVKTHRKNIKKKIKLSIKRLSL